MKLGRGVLLGALIGVAVVGCGADDDDDKCAKIDGTFEASISCGTGPSTCVVEQRKCRIEMTCDDGSEFTGKIRGKSLSFETPDGEVSCKAAVDGTYIDGTCDLGRDSCWFEAECLEGRCTKLGGGTSGGGSDSDDDQDRDEGSGSGGTFGSGGSFGSGGASGSAGRGGSGGSSGGGDIDDEEYDEECLYAVFGLCYCVEDEGIVCSDEELVALYALCVADEGEEAEILRCAASFVDVDRGTVDCGSVFTCFDG